MKIISDPSCNLFSTCYAIGILCGQVHYDLICIEVVYHFSFNSIASHECLFHNKQKQ